MEWRKRKKLRKKLQHYQSKRVKSLIRIMNELNAEPGKHVSEKTRAAFLKFCKQRPLHNYDEIVRKKAIRQKPKSPSVPTRNGRVYDYSGFMNAINNDKRITSLMGQNKWRGELNHPEPDSGYRIDGGEAIQFAQSAVIDLRNVAITPRMNISPEGEVKIVGFGLEKKEEASEAG